MLLLFRRLDGDDGDGVVIDVDGVVDDGDSGDVDCVDDGDGEV